MGVSLQPPGSGPYESVHSVDVQHNSLGISLVADAHELSDCSITTGTNRATSASNGFANATVGMGISLQGAGSAGAVLSSGPSNALRTITAVAVDGSYVDFDDPLHGLALTTVVAARVTSADGATTANSQTVTSATGAFTASDAGKDIAIPLAISDQTDPRVVTRYGIMASGSAVLTATFACFDAATFTAGKYVRISGAGTPSGGYAPPLMAKIVSRDSATQLTLDTTAGTTVAAAEVRFFGTATTLNTVIVAVTNGTTVVVRDMADFAVTGQVLSLSGGKAVFGTNNVPALNALIAAVPAGTKLTVPNGMYYLGLSQVTLNKQLTWEAAAKGQAWFLSSTSARFTVATGAGGSRFTRIGFRGMAGKATAGTVFTTVSTADESDFVFDDCIFKACQPTFSRINNYDNTGAITAACTGFAGNITLRRCEVTECIASYAVDVAGVEGFVVDDCDIHHNGLNPGAINSAGLKVRNNSRRVRLLNSRFRYNSYYGADLFDGYGTDAIGCAFTRNGGIGCDEKWNSPQAYDAPHRNTYVDCRFDLNGIYGANMGARSSLVSGCRFNGNLDAGVFLNHGGSGTSDVTLEQGFIGCEAVGNAKEGVFINQAVQYASLVGFQAHSNGGAGISNGGTDNKLVACHAFNNYVTGAGSIYHAQTCTRVQQVACQSDDANGQYVAHGSAVDVTVHGVNFAFGATTGTKIGAATTDKFAFHGSAPVIQRVGAAQAAVATTASTQTTPFGFSTQAQADALVALVNELRAALVEKGLIKGSA